MSTKYMIRYIHKIHPRSDDLFPLGKTPHPVELSSKDEENKNSLAAALRKVGALRTGCRLKSIRRESGKIIAFPSSGSWWSLILSPVGGS